MNSCILHTIIVFVFQVPQFVCDVSSGSYLGPDLEFVDTGERSYRLKIGFYIRILLLH